MTYNREGNVIKATRNLTIQEYPDGLIFIGNDHISISDMNSIPEEIANFLVKRIGDNFKSIILEHILNNGPFTLTISGHIHGLPIDFWISTDENKVMLLSELIAANNAEGVTAFEADEIRELQTLKEGQRYYFGHCGSSYIERIPDELVNEWEVEPGGYKSFPEYMEALNHYDFLDNL